MVRTIAEDARVAHGRMLSAIEVRGQGSGTAQGLSRCAPGRSAATLEWPAGTAEGKRENHELRARLDEPPGPGPSDRGPHDRRCGRRPRQAFRPRPVAGP